MEENILLLQPKIMDAPHTTQMFLAKAMEMQHKTAQFKTSISLNVALVKE